MFVPRARTSNTGGDPSPRRSRLLYMIPVLLVVTTLSLINGYFHPSTTTQGSTVDTLGPLRATTPMATTLSTGSSLDSDALVRLESGLQSVEARLAALTSAVEGSSSSSSGGGSSGGGAGAPHRALGATLAAGKGAGVQPSTQGLPRRRKAPIVLGMAKGIDVVGAYRFVRTLRTHTPDAEVVIFTDKASLDADPQLGWLYEAFGVTLSVFDLGALPAAIQGYHPSSYRWILMRDWMASREGREGGGASPQLGPVFFSDVRDTLFQGDFFSALEKAQREAGVDGGEEGAGGGFFAFQEQRPGTIAQCGWNSGWVKDCFGVEGLAKVGGNVVSCSGTSAGGWKDAMAYVQLMADTLIKSPHCERNGIDQGMHNYFVYSGELAAKVSSLHLVSNEEGFIATVQSMPSLNRDLVGRVLNAKGEVVAAVHQYDRSQILQRQYEGEYPLVPKEERGRKN